MKNQSAQVNLDELKSFLLRANMPHANGTAKITKELDGSRTIEYAEGDYRMHDNFFCGEPYGGRPVVFYKEEALLLEVYYGRAYETQRTADEVYGFLREALQHPDINNPYRGPEIYKRGQLTYRSFVEGDITNHTVKEYIYDEQTEIYSALVVGGVVDQNAKDSM
jgi:hypothetical protein